MKKVNSNLVATSLFTVGQYATVLAPDTRWAIGLSAFITLTAGAWEIGKILFEGIDIDKLKDQVIKNQEQARLFWSIIDIALKEASEEKIKIYNKYLQSAHSYPQRALEYNSKTLLIIQQLTIQEMRIFIKICQHIDEILLINLIHNKDNTFFSKHLTIDAEAREKWLENYSKSQEKKVQYFNAFFQEDVKKHELFSELEITNEIDMLASYGVLKPDHGLFDGTAYSLTKFGEYFLDFITKEN